MESTSITKSGMGIYTGTAIEDSIAAQVTCGTTLTGLRVNVFRNGRKQPAIISLRNLNRGVWAPVVVNPHTVRLVGYEK